VHKYGLALAVALFVSPAIAADNMAGGQSSSAHDWSGFYVGAVGGYGWGGSSLQEGPTASNPLDIDGLTFGATAGYSFQFHPNWIAGVEADMTYSAIDGTFGPGNLGAVNGGVWNCQPNACAADIDWYGTLRGRLGYAMDNLLVFGTGGLAFGHVEGGITGLAGFWMSDVNTGWTAGAGAEYAFAENWSAKLEYLYVDLGWTGYNGSDFRLDADFHTVRFGLNYSF